MDNKRFESLLSTIRDVPALPDVVVKVMRMTRDPNVTASKLNEVISLDPALTGNILRLCNSAYYGLPRVISSLTQAIQYLGFHTVRNLVLTCALCDLLGGDRPIYGHGKGGLWLHSYACALACAQLCDATRPALQDTAFTAGLLQDLGKVIIHDQAKDTESSIVELMVEENVTLTRAEKTILGYTHAEMGAALAERWNFPTELVHAICYHHNPESAPSKVFLTSLVHIADATVIERGFGIELEQLRYPLSKYALQKTGLTDVKIEKSLTDLDQHVRSAASTIGLLDEPTTTELDE